VQPYAEQAGIPMKLFLNSESILWSTGQARRWRHAASSLIIALWQTAVSKSRILI